MPVNARDCGFDSARVTRAPEASVARNDVIAVRSGPSLDERDRYRASKCRSACYHPCVLRTVGAVLRVGLLLVFAVAITGLAPDLPFGSSLYHYDGDSDDACHVGKLRAHGVETAVTDTRLTVW